MKHSFVRLGVEELCSRTVLSATSVHVPFLELMSVVAESREQGMQVIWNLSSMRDQADERATHIDAHVKYEDGHALLVIQFDALPHATACFMKDGHAVNEAIRIEGSGEVSIPVPQEEGEYEFKAEDDQHHVVASFSVIVDEHGAHLLPKQSHGAKHHEQHENKHDEHDREQHEEHGHEEHVHLHPPHDHPHHPHPSHVHEEHGHIDHGSHAGGHSREHVHAGEHEHEKGKSHHATAFHDHDPFKAHIHEHAHPSTHNSHMEETSLVPQTTDTHVKEVPSQPDGAAQVYSSAGNHDECKFLIMLGGLPPDNAHDSLADFPFGRSQRLTKNR